MEQRVKTCDLEHPGHTLGWIDDGELHAASVTTAVHLDEQVQARRIDEGHAGAVDFDVAVQPSQSCPQVRHFRHVELADEAQRTRRAVLDDHQYRRGLAHDAPSETFYNTSPRLLQTFNMTSRD